jgi:hypothetical protein
MFVSIATSPRRRQYSEQQKSNLGDIRIQYICSIEYCRSRWASEAKNHHITDYDLTIVNRSCLTAKEAVAFSHLPPLSISTLAGGSTRSV